MFCAFGCNIKGSNPGEIGNLSSLSSIDLDNNEITGFIPSTLGKLKEVERMYLVHNIFEGNIISSELCQIIRLGDLYLSGNNLNGGLPKQVGNLTSLNCLYLSENNLTGTMSADLFTLKVHHGGMFVNEGVFQYVGGTVTLFEELDPDFMSFYEILNPIRRLGYPPTIVMWLPNSELENGLRLIDSDRVVCIMFVEYSAENCNVVDVYVENIDIDIPLPMVPPLDPPYINDLPHGPPYINDPTTAEAVEEGINDPSDIEATEEGINDPLDTHTTEEGINDPPEYEAAEATEADLMADFGFFAEGDTLSDNCDSLGNDELEGVEVNQIIYFAFVGAKV
ncbi:hypothetical protein BUALT_Bualt08G0127300 [Buddleja alternifolia]|uniref:PB1-like domain-containing protein n=1 Tax=Buddleja alternifolia TaxID=168488 RepID=A0AAV6X5B8_9LAMI|nr:hypothetical protein BUALT_Bualt08G0127300 [Buddleja alternifolia]